MTKGTPPTFKRPYKSNTRAASRPFSPSRSRRRFRTGLGVPPATTAVAAKLIVATTLMRQGWDVFRPLSAASFFDLLAISPRTKRILKLEVRTGYHNPGTDTITYSRTNTEGKTVAVVVFADPAIPMVYFARWRTRRLALKCPLP